MYLLPLPATCVYIMNIKVKFYQQSSPSLSSSSSSIRTIFGVTDFCPLRFHWYSLSMLLICPSTLFSVTKLFSDLTCITGTGLYSSTLFTRQHDTPSNRTTAHSSCYFFCWRWNVISSQVAGETVITANASRRRRQQISS